VGVVCECDGGEGGRRLLAALLDAAAEQRSTLGGLVLHGLKGLLLLLLLGLEREGLLIVILLLLRGLLVLQILRLAAGPRCQALQLCLSVCFD